MHLGRTVTRFSCQPKLALGGVLALLLLVATTVSASQALHELLHQDGTGGDHFCLACSLAKGQVSLEAVAFISVLIAFCYLWGVCPVSTSPFPGFDYRTSPSRAPPPA
ncbi:MAG: hypothetical protein NT154_33225 [Verrucomicrobia bacterium]|nr:hypothetical protein [Verrucomicrobiota bacterium]